MQWLLLIFGIIVLSVAYETTNKAGAALLALLVLGALVTAAQKGLI
jgi:hypothetical protein